MREINQRLGLSRVQTLNQVVASANASEVFDVVGALEGAGHLATGPPAVAGQYHPNHLNKTPHLPPPAPRGEDESPSPPVSGWAPSTFRDR